MDTDKKRLPAQDVIREDSGPPVTETEAPDPPVDVNVDDAMIEEPNDHVFENVPDQSKNRRVPSPGNNRS